MRIKLARLDAVDARSRKPLMWCVCAPTDEPLAEDGPRAAAAGNA